MAFRNPLRFDFLNTFSLTFTHSQTQKILSKKFSKWFIGLSIMPGWAYGKTVSNDPKLQEKPLIDRCINCGEQKPVKTRITMEFGEGNYNSGPICIRCYSGYVFNRVTLENF